MSLHADLTSVMSTLDQVLERLDEVSESVTGPDRDDFLLDVYEVERHLKSAARRLQRTLNSMPESHQR